MDLKKYDCFVGTSRGVVIYDLSKQNHFKYQKPEDPSEITALTFGKNEEIILGHENGKVSVFDPTIDKYKTKIKDLEGDGRIVGLSLLNKTVIAARHDGIINLWRSKKNTYFDINLDENGTLETMVLHTGTANIVGTGGEHNELKLWDIETHQCVFKAKSQGHDMLNLPIPTSIRSIAFFGDNENLSVCCTKEGQVLLYDDKAQRRPVLKFSEKKASYTTLSATNRDRQCLVGTTKGYMQLIDMRNAKCLKTFTAFTGSITSIYCDPFEPHVFTTSLDRFFRVHNLETKQLLHKIYLKQNLTKILVKPSIKEESDEEIQEESKIGETANDMQEENKIPDEEYEELFESMETVGEEVKRKRKHNEVEKKKKRKKKKSKNTDVISET